jgi:integrase
MTYGCLLRPHREVRELTWGDFTADLSYIKLSGSRNKSGRNRIVPVPSYIKELLNKGDNNLNIFTGTTKAPNPDYFKTIWGVLRWFLSYLNKTKHFTLLGIQGL